MIFIDLINCMHDLLLLIVRMNYGYELFSSDWSLFDMCSIEMSHTEVTIHIHGFVDTFKISHVNFQVHLVQNDIVLLVIDPCNVKSWLLISSFHSWERIDEFSFLLLWKFNSWLFSCSHEIIKDYLTLIILVSQRFNFCDELNPFLSNLLKHACKNINGKILMHLLMEDAEVAIVFGWLPAFLVMAAVDLTLLELILSKIETFSWEHLTTDRQLEIFVRDKAIHI